MKTIYIAGPMTGIDDFNFPAFFKAEQLELCNYTSEQDEKLEMNVAFMELKQMAEKE